MNRKQKFIRWICKILKVEIFFLVNQSINPIIEEKYEITTFKGQFVFSDSDLLNLGSGYVSMDFFTNKLIQKLVSDLDNSGFITWYDYNNGNGPVIELKLKVVHPSVSTNKPLIKPPSTNSTIQL